MHAARWRALHDVAIAAVGGKLLTLTALALGTTRSANLRRRIKCVDRLLANPHLEKERIDAYCALAHEWLAGLPQLLIVVDWSPVTDDPFNCSQPETPTATLPIRVDPPESCFHPDRQS